MRSVSARRRREGNIALLLAILLPMMMAFVALSVDIGTIYRVRTADQSAVDSAALAGASGLNGTSAGLTNARARATDYGGRHLSYNRNVALAAGDITTGNWNLQTQVFTATNDLMASNAVRVLYRSQTFPTPFAAVRGRASTTVRNQAIGLGGGPVSAPCAFPLVVADCAIPQATLAAGCDTCLVNASAPSDTAAWTSFNASNGTTHIGDAVTAACNTVNTTTHECVSTGTCEGLSNSTSVDLNGGNFLNQSPNGPCMAIRDRLLQYGWFTTTVAVVQTGRTPGNCGSASLNGNQPVAGFLKLDIYGIGCGNGPRNAANSAVVTPPNSSSSTTCGAAPSSGKFVLAALHRKNGVCDDTPINAPAGGQFYGTLGMPRLVD